MPSKNDKIVNDWKRIREKQSLMLAEMTFDEQIKFLNNIGEKFENDVAETRQQRLAKDSKPARKYAN
ncbi:MAG: hypothetical protein FWG20_02705 [Candidatus Cloacimonetes bacterium]|nr:hypothetical protein [Candidatus Cloacimonadota bacterium]